MHQTIASDAVRLDEVFVTAIRRARSEFLEMPGLRLTPSQAARLWAVEPELCCAVLDALVATRFLARKEDSTFARADGSC